MTRKKKCKRPSPAIIEALEPRILFSADAFSVALDYDNGSDPLADALEQARQEYDALVVESKLASKQQHAVEQESATDTPDLLSPAIATSEITRELVFVDTDTPDYQQLVDDLTGSTDSTRQFNVILLDNSSDGIAQITAALSRYSELDAVHIISHGENGAIDLGASQLNQQSLNANSDAIGLWSNAFSANGDLLIYGCNLAATSDGELLVNRLAAITGADVAASDDLTGNAAQGGDWDLEYHSGTIETALAPSVYAQQNWSGLLASFIVDTTDDTIDANLGDGFALDAAGNTSLRAAIMEANALAGADSITLSSATYTLTLGGTGEDAAATGDLDITNDLTIVGAGNGLTFIDGGALDRVFHMHGGTAVFSDMTIQNGLTLGGNDGAGIAIAVGADLTIDTVQIRNNQTSTTSGAGAGVYNEGTVTIVDSTISNNFAAGQGGGLQNLGTATIEQSLFQGNISDLNGGAIFNTGTGTLDLTNVTISGNQSVANGGGIYSDSTVVATNITVTNNESTSFYGGGVYVNSSSFTSTNSIYAGNFDNYDLRNDFYGTVVSGGHNIIGDTTGASGFGGTDQLNTNPLLDVLYDNGGPTLTHALLAPSTAINPAGLTGAPATDARGTARDGSPDIGAYEYVAGGPNTLVVTTTNDQVNGSTSSINALLLNDGGDGISLREAILAANNTTLVGGVANQVHFHITADLVGGTHTIQVGNATDGSNGVLPTITRSIAIDGSSESDFNGTPIIELDGQFAAGSSDDGLTLATTNSTISGLVINRFGDEAIYINGGSGNTITGNYIGTDVTGTIDLGNGGIGIELNNSANNIIGGSLDSQRNVISGNAAFGISLWNTSSTGNVVQGNYIGVDSTGNAALGNSSDGVVIGGGASNNTIGGDRTAGEGNVLSGNIGASVDGIEIYGTGTTGNKVYGNYIGTNFDGTAALGNDRYGVVLYNGAQNTEIGGLGIGEGNIIAGNTNYGVIIDGANLTNTHDNTIQANIIGLGSDGITIFANAGGVLINQNAYDNTVGGTSTAARNVISGNNGAAVYVANSGTDGNKIQGNYIGTDVGGTLNKGNTANSIDINTGASNNLVGGGIVGAGNTIGFSGNDGITIWGSGTANNTVQGNFVGTDSTGTLDLGNSQNGIIVSGWSTGNLIGGTGANDGNLVFHNNSIGIEVRDTNTVGNTILGNRIYDNTLAGIDLGGDGVTDNDANDTDNGNSNDRQNFPVLSQADLASGTLTVSGTLDTNLASTDYHIEFFGNAAGDQDTTNGEGRVFLGSTTITTNGSGDATFAAVELTGVTLSSGDFVTATATVVENAGQVGVSDLLAYGSTSEFAVNFAIANVDPVVTFGGGNVSYVENAAAIFIDATATVSDVDSNNFDGGVLSISATANGSGDDRIRINNEGMGAGQVGMTTGPNEVYYSGALIGTWSGSGAPLAITFNVTADATAVEAVAQNITFENLSDAPSTLTRTIQFQLTDGDGGTSAAITKDINVTAANDSPLLADGNLATTYKNNSNPNGQSVIAIFNSGFVDPDASSSLAGVAVVGNTANAGTEGTWEYSSDGGANWYAIGSVDDATNALALDAATKLRFVPALDYSGSPTELTVRAIDNSYVGAFTTSAGSEARAPIDTTSNGGTTPIEGNTSLLTTSISDEVPSLWLSTSGDDNSSGFGGLASVEDSDILAFSDPNLALGDVTTGTASKVFNIDAFTGDEKLNGLHYVQTSLTLGGTSYASVDVNRGDVIFALEGSATLTSGASSVSVDAKDVVLFSPDTQGDYSSGTFTVLLNDPTGDSIRGVTLIESNTVVGDTTVNAGDFLLVTSGGADKSAQLFQVDDVGDGINTVGSSSILIDGDDLNVGVMLNWYGIHLISNDTTIGGTNLTEGQILITVNGPATVGTNDLVVDQYDIFALNITKTTIGAGVGNGEASASLLLDGSDVGLDAGNEAVNAIALAHINTAPTDITASTTAINENINTTGGYNLGALISTDQDIGDTADYSIVGGADAAKFTLGGVGVDELILDDGVLDFESKPSYAVTIRVTDSVGNTYDETLTITVNNLNDAPVATDDHTRLDFDGTDDYVLIADSASLTMTSTMTMEAWIQPDTSANAYQMIMNKEGEYEVALFADGSLAWAFGGTDPAWGWINTGYIAADNEWIHIAVSYDNGVVNSYVNGSLVHTYNGSGPIGDANGPMDTFRIGGRENAPAGQYFDGKIDDVRVWNTARTQDEIQANLDANLAGNETGLAGYWKLNEGSSTTASDLTANANHGTLTDGAATGTPLWSAYVTDQDTPHVVLAADGVLANDIDADGDTLTVTKVNGAAVGGEITLLSGAKITMGSAGDFSYNPNGAFDYLDLGESAVDSFIYEISDGNGGTDTAFAYITITGINDTPTAGTIADFSVPEDSANSTIDLKAIFEDAEDTDTELTYSIQSNSNAGLFDSVTISGTKILTLDYAADQNGFADITLRATDTSGEFVEVSFRVTVDPVNDAPVLSVETGDSVAETLTETNATLSVSDTVTVTDIEMTDLVSSSVLSVVESGDTSGIANATLLAMMGISGDLDATETSEALVWAFNSGAENFNYLQAGETLTLTYTVQVDDGTAQDTQTIVITINGSNDAPVLSVETGDSVAETLTETNTTLSVSDTVTVTDVDLTDLVSSSVLSVVESGNTSGIANGTLLAMMGISGDLDATETSEALVWTFNSGAENFNYLQAGETLTLTYTVQVDDGTAQDTQTIVITINGSNDAPVLSVETGDSVAETLTETNTTLSISDTVTVTDVDLTDLVSSSVLSVVESGNTSGIANATLLAMMGISGDLDATETSEALVWAFNSGAENFNYLQAGETLTLTYTVQVDDGTAQDTQTIVITINGSNDAPVLSVETGDSVAETLTETNTTLSISDTVTVTDVDLTDLVSSRVLSVVESGNTSGIANATLLAMMGISGDLDATETSEALVWAFNSGAESFNYLQAGETLTLTYTVEVDDGTAQDTQTIVITINGSNDAPVLSVETGDSVAETLTETNTTLSISDTVTVTDLDLTDLVSSSVLSVVESGNTSGIANGTLLAMMGITGDLDATETSEALVWAFNSGAESFDYLQAGETLTLTYTVQVDDGTAQDTQTIVITINGSNDAPVLTVETGDSVAENLTETNTTLSVSDTVTVTDVDLTDLVSSSVLSVVESGNTSGIANATLLAMMGISGDLDATETSEALVWAFNSGAESFDYLQAGETLTLTYTVQVDDGTAQDTQTIVITINGSNDAPVLSVETGDSVAETLTETNTTLSVSDTVTVTDVDLTDLVSSSVLSVVESGTTSGIANATLLAMMGISGDLDATETSEALIWAFNSGAESFDYLEAGQSLTLTYTVQVDDGTAQDTQTIVITINGSNDAPVLSVETGDSVAETLTETNTTLSISDTVTVTDVDLTDLVSSSVLSVVESGTTSGIANSTLLAMMGISGDLDATETSEALVWAFNSGAETFDYLEAGQTLTLTYTVQVDDGTAQDTQTIVITINGSNDAPVLSVETGDSVAETLTETNTTLSVSDTVTVTDVDLTDLVSSSVLSVVESGDTSGIANATLLAMMGISGDLDATETSEALVWAFNSGAENFNYLQAGETLTLTYTVQVDDGTAQDTQTIVITINGSNDAPVLSVETGDSVAETLTETNSTLSISDTVTVTDVDLTDLVSSSVISVVESGDTSGIANGTLLAMMGITGDLDATETSEALVWAFNSGAETFDYLIAGQTLTLTYTVQADDGTTQDTQTIVITINGNNDAPVIGGVDTGAVTEDVDPDSDTLLEVNNALTITDPDASESSFVAETIVGTYGDLVIDAAGNWSYSADNTQVAIQQLDVTEFVTDTFTVTTADGSTHDIVITINGAEDAPTVDNAIPDQSTAEDSVYNYTFDANVFGDADASDTFTYAAQLSGGAALPSWLTFNDATRSFVGVPLNADVGFIDIEVIADDGSSTVSDVFRLTVTNTDDAPTIGGDDTGAVTEDIDPDSDTLLEDSGALTIADPDVGESSFVAETIVGTYGNLVIDSAGNWSYSADNTQAAIQQLDVTESITDTLTVTTADGTTHDIVITINGAEDAPVQGGTNTGTVFEDGTLVASNTLTITDTDTNDNPISYNDQTSIAGSNGYGNFEMSGNTWTYTLNNSHAAVQALDVTESLTDTFTFTATDGSSTQTVTVTIDGAEDAPTVDNAIPNQSATEDAAYSFTFNANSFGDVDTSDTLTYTAQLNGGGALPGWLTFNAGTRTFSGTPLNADVGAISIDVIADDGSSTVTDTFTLTVSNTNDAPVIGGVDTGAVTEDVDPDSDTLLEVNNALTIADPDVGESSFVAETIVGTYGNLVIDSAGNWSYSADNTQAAIQQLDVSEFITDTLTVTTADGTTHNIVITINGAEDAPVLGGTNTGTVFEDGTLVASNTLTITDTDTNDNPISYNDQTSIAGSNGYGNFEMSGNTWTYTLNNSHAAVQALDVTESLTDTFTFTATDGSSTQTVTVTIDGAEDAPTVNNVIPDQSATEDSPYSFTFNANSFGDVDTSDTLTYTAQLNGGGALPGWLTFNAGTRTFSGTPLNADVGTISIDVIADDGSSTVTDTFTLTVNNTDDAPTIGGDDTGAVTEDIDPDSDTLLEDSGALTIADPDVGESSFVAETIVGTYGNLVIDSAGNWSYSADNTQAAIQQLDVTESITDTLTVTTADGTTHDIVITINGAEDAPVLGGTNTGTVFEDGTLVASNTLTITDTDTNDNPISYNDQTSIAGSNGYGNFVMSGNAWTYTLNNSHAAVQALDVTESLTDTFTFTATDGSSTQTVTVTIDGAEDAPTVDNAIPDQSATEDSPYSFTFNANSFGDVDTSDTLTYTAQLNGGGGLPGWLSFDVNTRTFSGTPLNADVGSYNIDVTADDGSSTVTDTFTLTVNNTDDAPVIGGVDTGAVTEDVDPDSDGLLEVNDALTIADPDVGESSFVAETINGTYGDLVIDTVGNWSYSADNTQTAIQQLDVSESITDTLTVTTFDGSTHNIVITINGAEDAPVLGGINTGTVAEDGTLVASNTLTITDTDSNDNPISYNDQTSIAGNNGYGNFEMSGNTWTYTLGNGTNAVQSLDAGQVVTDSYTFTASDGSTQSVTVTINGAEDASVAGGINTGTVAEDGTLVASDTLTITDVDTNDNPVSYVDRASTAGDNSFGSFAISGNNWNYTLNNSLVAVQALDAGDTLNDSTTFTATDGTTRTVTVTINGSEDAPTASDASITFDQGATYILNAGSFGFTDIDNGDTLNSITVTALPSAGELKLAGSDVSLNQVINRADIDAGQLTFAATGIESGPDYASFDFTVNDGALESASANTLSFSITTLIDPEPEPEPEPDPDPEEEEVTTTPPSEPETAPVVDEATDIPVDPSDEPLAPVDGNPEIGIELPEPLAIEAVVELLNTSDKDDGDLSRSLPKQLDLNNLDITNYTIENLELLQMQSLFNNNDFVNALDKLSFELDRVAAQEQSDYGLGAETRLGIAVSLSAGFVSWALRAGSLLASVFSVMPLWKQLDPLPIVGTKTEKEKELEANTERDEPTENQADDPNNPHARAQKQETKLEKLFRN